MTNIIKWLVSLKADKAILAILLIAVSVLWATGISDKKELRQTINTKTEEVIRTKQEVVECKVHEAELLKELYFNVMHIEDKTKVMDSTTKIVENVAINNSKKINKLLKNEKK